MGDPAGVGPEICLHALSDPAIAAACVPIVFGDLGILRRVASECGLAAPTHVLGDASELTNIDQPAALDLNTIDAGSVTPGATNAATGDAAYRYIVKAITCADEGWVDAVCTAPISKEALHAAGHKYPGHTEIFAEKTGAARSCMLFVSDALCCSLVTIHTGLEDVAGSLTEKKIFDVITLTAEAMRRIRGKDPSLVVCGLNPHAGEKGLIGGGEEEALIAPAIERARESGIEVNGPLSADTAFLPQRRAQTDAYVCMYHDQALIPLKMLAFDTAVNMTLGLPFVRTSVDHGTALDIAWQGKASPNSMREAILLAAKLAG
jgi:4-hydroxythreonine-4-phosphate dehydrogenase